LAGLLEEEERRRDHMGMSAFGKCMALVEIADALAHEGHSQDAGAVLKLFKSAKLDSATWNQETCARYISVGRRLSSMPPVVEILERWESYMGREALFDNITALRAFTGLNVGDEESIYVASISSAAALVLVLPNALRLNRQN
jgi:hypothetical protein